MAGRALAFADKEIVRMATHEYIPVAADDWYQRRRNDAEGEFFRRVADQGPRKGQAGSTRQGIYCLTASGKLLAYRNHQDPQVMREVLRQGLAEWRKLPEAERRPGFLQVPPLQPGQLDPRYHRAPPAGALIVKVYTRALDRAADGGYCECAAGTNRYGQASALDHLWLTRSEWLSLFPQDRTAGDSWEVPPAVAGRIARFHLVDNTRGEPPAWRQEEVRLLRMRLTALEVPPGELRLRLDGEVLLATAADPHTADRGYDARLLGYLACDPRRPAVTRFDVVALGEHWGEGPYTAGARPGRSPLGVAFTLAAGDRPADRIPPQGIRDPADYLGGNP